MLKNQFKIGDRVRGRHREGIYTGVIIAIESNKMYINQDNGDEMFTCKIRDNGHVAAADGLDNEHNLELIKSITAKELNKQSLCMFT